MRQATHFLHLAVRAAETCGKKPSSRCTDLNQAGLQKCRGDLSNQTLSLRLIIDTILMNHSSGIAIMSLAPVGKFPGVDQTRSDQHLTIAVDGNEQCGYVNPVAAGFDAGYLDAGHLIRRRYQQLATAVDGNLVASIRLFASVASTSTEPANARWCQHRGASAWTAVVASAILATASSVPSSALGVDTIGNSGNQETDVQHSRTVIDPAPQNHCLCQLAKGLHHCTFGTLARYVHESITMDNI